MSRVFWVVLAIFSYVFVAPVHASPRADLFRYAKAATALIMAINDASQSVSMGSGFFVNSDGLLVTNFHVIEDSTRLYLYVGDQFIHTSPEVMAVDPDLDLAALQISQHDLETLTLSTDMPAEGAEVIAVGYPRITDILQMGFALHPTVGVGLVSGLAQGQSRTRGGVAGFVQTTGILNFGNSGGPLIDTESGEVAGMVVTTVPYLERAKDRSGTAIASVTMKSGIGYSIPAPVISRWLESRRLRARPSANHSKTLRSHGVEPETNRSFATGHLLHTIALVFQNDSDLLRLAVQHYETAIGSKADTVWMEKNLGQAYAATGRWNDAVEAFRKGLAQTPHDVGLLCDLGVAWERLGHQDRAAEAYRAAVRANPRSGQAHNNLGFLLWKMGQLDEAIGEFRLALSVEPGLVVAIYNLGLALDQNGSPEEAVTAWEMYLQNPSPAPEALEWTTKMRDVLPRLKTASEGKPPVATLANSARNSLRR